MRYATALLLPLAFAAPLAAQPCDPSQADEVCPDTTDWHRYFPLGIGNQWQYRDAFFEEPVAHWSWRIVGETEVDGQSYFEIKRCNETDDGSATCGNARLIRYDNEHAMLVRRNGSEETWWMGAPCRLDVAFNDPSSNEPDETYACTGPGTEGFSFAPSYGVYDASVTVSLDVVSGDTRKSFALLFALDWSLYAGLGTTAFYYELQGEPTRLVHALVGGEQIGSPAFATCDPSDLESGIACPDTTDWRRYVPLEVGNEWQYTWSPFTDQPYEHGTRVTGTTEIDGEAYFLAQRCERPLGEELTCEPPFPIRYDEANRAVVRRTTDTQGEPEFSLFQPSDYVPICPLDAPFADGLNKGGCALSDDALFSVSGAYGAGYQGLGDTRKMFGDGLQGDITFVAGVGAVGSENVDADIVETLVYARVGDDEIGTPLFSFPTADEPGGSTPEPFALRTVYPNPARTTATATFTLDRPQEITLELVDVLGRVVLQGELGPQTAGSREARLDLGGLRAGLYVLRLRGDENEATRRFVVLR